MYRTIFEWVEYWRDFCVDRHDCEGRCAHLKECKEVVNFFKEFGFILEKARDFKKGRQK